MTTNHDQFLAGYIGAALWSSYDESDENGGNPMDQNYSDDDLAAETLEAMQAACERFQSENAALLSIYYQHVNRVDDSPVEAYAGHDFWLSRNGHGAGFFDRDYVPSETQDALQSAAEAFGNFDLYIGDDGRIYQ